MHNISHDIPQALLDLEPLLSFQWGRHSLYGDTSITDIPRLEQAGWRIVSSGPIFEVFKYFQGNISSIIKDGLILMKRDKRLTEWAKQEDYNKAMLLKQSVEHMALSERDWNNRYSDQNNGVSLRFTDKGCNISIIGNSTIDEVKEKLEYIFG